MSRRPASSQIWPATAWGEIAVADVDHDPARDEVPVEAARVRAPPSPGRAGPCAAVEDVAAAGRVRRRREREEREGAGGGGASTCPLDLSFSRARRRHALTGRRCLSPAASDRTDPEETAQSTKRRRAGRRGYGNRQRRRPRDAETDGCCGFIPRAPPVTTLTLVRDDLADALAAAEQLVADEPPRRSGRALEELWAERARRCCARAATPPRALLERDVPRRARARGRAARARRDDRQVAALRRRRPRRGSLPPRLRRVQAAREVADATSLFTRALDLNEHAPRRAHAARRQRLRVALALPSVPPRLGCSGDATPNGRSSSRPAPATSRRRHTRSSRRPASPSAARIGSSPASTRERALELYRKHGDMLATARILNNLGGIDFLLGDVATAEENLIEAAETAAEAGSDPDLAQAVNTLAHVFLQTGRPLEARVRAERAVELLTGRDRLPRRARKRAARRRTLARGRGRARARSRVDRRGRAAPSRRSARRATSRSPGSRAATSRARPATSTPRPISIAALQIPSKTSISRRR